MRGILKILKYLLAVAAIFIAHVLILNILPFPFNHINVVLIVFLWLIIYSGSARVLWLALPLAFLLELFVSFPFGLTSSALIITLMIMYWILRNIFTNRSLFIVFFAGFLGIAIFRFSFLMILLLINLFNPGFTLSWPEVLTNIFYEVILTAALFFLIYLLTALFFRRLNPKYISYQRLYGPKRII